MSKLPEIVLAAQPVIVWSLDLSSLCAGAHEDKSILAPDELERAARFREDTDRNRFIVVRATLRRILAADLDSAPESLLFVSSPKGKPALASPASGLRFSVSHSRKRALIAVTRHREIGVDLEFIRQDLEIESLAERFFSPAECRLLVETSAAERGPAFFQIWTAKEAYVKALGQGLSLPLSSFDIGFDPATGVALVGTRPDPANALRWNVQAILIENAYKASLAIEGTVGELTVRQYRPS